MSNNDGMTREEILASLYEERRKVIRGECPDCGGALIKKLDAYQGGVTSVEGDWHKVTCSGCDYHADWCIPEQVN